MSTWIRKAAWVQCGALVAGFGVVGCSAGGDPASQSAERVGSQSEAILSGTSFEAAAHPQVALPLVCEGAPRATAELAALVARTYAVAPGFEQCLQHVMLSGGDSPFAKPYNPCLDGDGGLVDSLADPLTTFRNGGNKSLAITCAGGAFASGASLFGSSLGAGNNRHIWLSQGLLNQVHPTMFERDDLYAQGINTTAVRLGGIAGTILHEASHTIGFAHDCPNQSDWFESVPYLINFCANLAWQQTGEHCAATTCLEPGTMPLFSSFDAFFADADPTTFTCECVRDPAANSLATLDAPASPKLGAPIPSEHFGTALVYGDFNGDDFPDLAVGAPDGAANPGSVLVYRGTPFGYYPWTTIALEAQAGAAFGAALSAWDLDDDGYADLAVGAPGAAAGTGKVYVVPGSVRGLNGDAAVGLTGVANDGEFGASLGIGRLSQSGAADPYLVVGSPGASAGGQDGAGTARIYHVPSGAALSLDFVLSLTAPDGPSSNARFAEAIAVGDSEAAGDVFVIGAPGASRAYKYFDINLHDFIFLDAPTPPASVVLTPPGEVSGFGSLLSVGTLLNSTIHGVAIGSRQENDLWIYDNHGDLRSTLAGLPGDKLAIASMNVENPGNAGFDDLLVATGAGVSYFVGAFGDVADEPKDLLTSPDDAGRGFGATMLTNVPNGFGERTLLVAAPRQFSGASQSGRVYSFLADGGNPNAFALTRVLDKAEGTGSEDSSLGGGLDEQAWTPMQGADSSQLRFDDTLKTAGEASLLVDATGYVQIGSALFDTAELAAVGSSIELDIHVPQTLPASGWGGAVQLFLNVPSAGIYTSYVGQVELTPLSPGDWHVGAFTLTAAQQQALLGFHADARLIIAVNTEPSAPGRVHLDNLRFGGTLTPHVAAPAPVYACTGDCSNATLLGSGQYSGALGSGEKWFVVSAEMTGWQGSDLDDRTVTVNGVDVAPGQFPLPPSVDGMRYFHFSAGSKPWASWSFW
jgi:hypothetical protein